MLTVTLHPEDAKKLLQRYLRAQITLADSQNTEAGAIYDLPGGPLVSQTGVNLIIGDDNWPLAMGLLRDLARLASSEISFMHDEDGLMFGIVSNDTETPQEVLDDHRVHTGPDLVQFIKDVEVLMAWEETEEEPDIVDQAVAWAEQECEALGTPGDQSDVFDFVLMAALPAMNPEITPPYGTATRLQTTAFLAEKRYRDEDGEPNIAAVGKELYLILDNLSSEADADFASGELSVYFDDEQSTHAPRERVVEIARSILSEKIPMVRVDVDHNAWDSSDGTYWAEAFFLGSDGIVQEPFYVETDP